MERVDSSAAPRNFFAPLSLALIVWGIVIHLLWNDWRLDPQYSYGLVVPLLVIGLFLQRWADRPEPMQPSWRERLISSGVIWSSALLLALIVPVAEANPDWRPLGVLASLSAVFLSLAVIILIGGWPWLRHFFFPIAFFLIAVPWTRNFEQAIMHLLMSWNTSVTIEMLHWGGFEAMRQGNLILLSSGVLGIEEACSGIRSLQSGLMVALFMGEIFRMSLKRRVLLVLLAFAAALMGNIMRSSLLAWIASSRGMSAVASWHDFAGVMVLFVTFALLLIASFRWRNFPSPGTPSQHAGKALSLSPNPHLQGMACGVILLLLLSLGGTEWWFQIHEQAVIKSLNWSLRERSGEAGVNVVKIPEATLRMLTSPIGFSEQWKIDPAGSEEGQVFYFRWPAGRAAIQAVNMHTPEVCLSNIGMQLKQKLAPVLFEEKGVRILFRSWLFDDRGHPVYVYQAILEESKRQGDEGNTDFDSSPKARLQRLISGRRNLGECMIEIAFWNLPNEVAASAALQHYLKETLSISPSASR